jgi:ferric-dicitrate binding protein FerR (iron transport regulator)
MTYKTGHNKNKKPGHGNLFEQFPADERDRIKEIWEASGRIADDRPDIPTDEVEYALSEVHKRIDANGGSANTENYKPFRINKWRWMLAAAVVIIAIGTGILFIPQTADAPYGDMVSVTLPDGSTVELNSGSELQYNRLFAFWNRDVSLDGEAFFSVRETDIPFTVDANGSEVRVTGTKFNVRSWSDDPGAETEVTVSKGTVEFYPEGHSDKSVKIYPGQLSKWALEMDAPTKPEPVSIDRMLAWRENNLMFNDKSLQVIFRELERRFDVEIDMQATGSAHETLSTYYAKPENVESILEDICRVKGLRYAETANGYRVYK